jgi:hypothetical protein
MLKSNIDFLSRIARFYPLIDVLGKLAERLSPTAQLVDPVTYRRQLSITEAWPSNMVGKKSGKVFLRIRPSVTVCSFKCPDGAYQEDLGSGQSIRTSNSACTKCWDKNPTST